MFQETAQNNRRQFVISFDGKLVAQGSKGDRKGDVDLWGIEKPVSVSNAIHLRDKLVKQSSQLEEPITSSDLDTHSQLLHRNAVNVLKQISKLRMHCCGEFFLHQRLFRMVEKNPDRAQSYCTALSWINTNSAD